MFGESPEIPELLEKLSSPGEVGRQFQRDSTLSVERQYMCENLEMAREVGVDAGIIKQLEKAVDVMDVRLPLTHQDLRQAGLSLGYAARRCR